MFKKSSVLALSVGALALTGACTPGKSVDDVGGQFWQRVSVSDATYQQGPKAQQMLNRDISRCVVELRELERLGTLKDAIPTDLEGVTLNPDEMALRDHDSPEREKHLFAEHSDYSDFESCMYDRGWERVEHAPYAVTRTGRENYLRAHVDYDYTPETEARRYMDKMNTNENGDFGDLND